MVESQASRFRVIKSINDLPPRIPKTIIIGSSGLNLDVISKYNSIAFDIQISNKDATTATVSLNGEIGFTLGSGADQTINNTQVSTINITGITTGFVLIQIVPISELQKLGAVEVR